MTHEELKSRIRRMPYDAIMLLTGKEMWKLTDGFDEELVREIVAKHRTPKGQRDAIRTLKTTRFKALQELGRPVTGPPQYFEDWIFDLKTGVLIGAAPPVVNEIVYNIQTKKSAEAETTDISKYKALLSEKDAEIASLKRQLEQKEFRSTKPEDAILKEEIIRLKQKRENMLVELLVHSFFNIEADARSYVKKIDNGMDSDGVAEVTRQYYLAKKIIKNKRGRSLWEILHAANLYDKVEQSWTREMRKAD